MKWWKYGPFLVSLTSHFLLALHKVMLMPMPLMVALPALSIFMGCIYFLQLVFLYVSSVSFILLIRFVMKCAAKALELFLQDLCDRTYEITLKRGAKTLNSLHL